MPALVKLVPFETAFETTFEAALETTLERSFETHFEWGSVANLHRNYVTLV